LQSKNDLSEDIMKARLILFLILCLSGLALTAETVNNANIDDMIFGVPVAGDTLVSPAQNDLRNDIITVNYQKKNAKLAMLYSALLPGLGQFYADKSAFRTYIYPVVELALIGGIVYFDAKGDDKTKAYEKYANGENITVTYGDFTYTGPRYRRDFQNNVQAIVMAHNANDIYDSTFFRLDAANSQHFYEDIGKYDKYVFGWADWYYTFAADPSGQFVLDNPDFSDAIVMSSDDYTAQWLGNYKIADIINHNNVNYVSSNSLSSSLLRKEYIKMRRASEDEYRTAHYLSFGLAANHIISAIDALVMTNQVNSKAITQSPFKMNYYTSIRDNHLTPSLGLSYSF